jgi:DNA transformation protein and related proteins
MSSLGPASAEMLIEAGVETPDQLRAMGAVEAYRRLRFACGRRATATFLYSLDVAIRGIHWKDLEPERMAQLRTIALAIQAEIDHPKGKG